MNTREIIKFGLYNTLFNEMPYHGDLNTFFWASFNAILLRNTGVIDRLQKTKGIDNSDVQTFIEQFQPHILVLHELLPQYSGDIEEFMRDNYQFNRISNPSFKGVDPHTLLAVNRKYSVEFDQKYTGAGLGAMSRCVIPDLNISILARNPSATNKWKRARELGEMADQAKEDLDNGITPIIIGDLNAGRQEVGAHFEHLGLKCIDEAPYPVDDLYQQLQKPQWVWLRRLMNVSHGQRHIDHIWIPQNCEVEDVLLFQGTSDHYGMSATIAFN